MTDRETLIAYLLMKVKQEDFHAVADAAMDLREMDAKVHRPSYDEWEAAANAVRIAQGIPPLRASGKKAHTDR